ncbi:unnamed protein product, partial [Didymodactylos carnosus]
SYSKQYSDVRSNNHHITTRSTFNEDNNRNQRDNNSTLQNYDHATFLTPNSNNLQYTEGMQEYQFEFGDSILIVKQGHIFEEKADAIVVDVNDSQPTEPVEAICKLAGDVYIQACNNSNPTDELLLMPAGNLHARYIIHLPLPCCAPSKTANQHYLGNLHDNLSIIFKSALKYRINRLSLVPVGCTRHHFMPENVIEHLHTAYLNHGTYVRDIVLVIDQSSNFQMWVDLCKKCTAEYSRQREQKKSDEQKQTDEHHWTKTGANGGIKESSANIENQHNSIIAHDLSKYDDISYNRYLLSNDTVLIIKRGDISKESTDVIVNAANEFLEDGAGVTGAIYKRAGPIYAMACKNRPIINRVGGRLERGKAIALPGGSLLAHCVIATVGPVFDRSSEILSREILFSCYKECLLLAKVKNYSSIAFPALSCGVYGYPVDKAAEVALEAVEKYPMDLKEIVFVLWEESTLLAWVKEAEKKLCKIR